MEATRLTVLLRLAASAIDTIEDLAHAPHLLFVRLSEELGPAVLAEQLLRVRVISIDLEYDLASRLRRIEHIRTHLRVSRVIITRKQVKLTLGL
jgi:hypothetical protein